MKKIWQSILAATVGITSSAYAQQPPLTNEQEQLLKRAETTVRNYTNAGKPFPLFAMAIEADGQLMSYLPTEEFSDSKAALVGVLKDLIPKARDGRIKANVLVTPMAPEPGTDTHFAVFDLEQRGVPRLIVMLPYRGVGKHATYGERQFKRGAPPKLFQ